MILPALSTDKILRECIDSEIIHYLIILQKRIQIEIIHYAFNTVLGEIDVRGARENLDFRLNCGRFDHKDLKCGVFMRIRKKESQRYIWGNLAKCGVYYKTLMGQMRAKRAKMCHCNAKIC